mmetsp:Transcript_20147/g.27756  ORF Transcript_20147/g.27756 Transcript_20147/m.27756 type:complete len:84 (+) Transcript_20147:79-330(+)
MFPLINRELPIHAAYAISKSQPLSEEELMTSINRRNSFLMNGQFESALEEFNRLADLSPNTVSVYVLREAAINTYLGKVTSLE